MSGPASNRSDADPPEYRSHYRPRTAAGRAALVGFLAVFGLTQPPVVHLWADRIAPWVVGLPFLYAYLLGLYIVLIGILIWVYRRGL